MFTNHRHQVVPPALSIVKFVNLVEGDPNAPFTTIATTL